MEQLTRHRLSTLWGDMPEDQYREFVEGIRERHIRQMIMTLDGEILDGWHRYKACLELCIEPFFAEYTGDDPAGYAISQNAHRRHLTAGQRAQMILGCREWVKAGRPKKGDKLSPFSTVAEISGEAGVSERTVQRAKSIEEAGLGDAVRSGELSPKAATAQAKGEIDKPKGPTLTERLQAQVDELSMKLQLKDRELVEKDREVEDLKVKVQWFEAQGSAYEIDHYQRVNTQQARIRTLEGGGAVDHREGRRPPLGKVVEKSSREARLEGQLRSTGPGPQHSRRRVLE